MKVTILSAEERRIYRAPGDLPYIVTIRYRTEKGYEGEVELEKTKATKENILKAIQEEISGLEGILKTTQTI